MWILKQCMDGWAAQGRAWDIEKIIREASRCGCAGAIDVDADPLLLMGEMPERINAELAKRGLAPIADIAGNEPAIARVIFESLAARYASALSQLEQMLGRKLKRVHVLGGGSRNQLLRELTAQRTGLPVEAGEAESSTIGSFAIQLATSQAGGQPITSAGIRQWAARLCQP